MPPWRHTSSITAPIPITLPFPIVALDPTRTHAVRTIPASTVWPERWTPEPMTTSSPSLLASSLNRRVSVAQTLVSIDGTKIDANDFQSREDAIIGVCGNFLRVAVVAPCQQQAAAEEPSATQVPRPD